MKDYIRNTLKQISAVLILTLSFFTYPALSAPQKPLKIYVMQVIQHPALDASRQGIYDELVAQGYRPDQDFVWVFESAQGNASLAAQMAQKAVGQKADAIVTLGTMVSQAALQAAKHDKIPVIFASVTDPVGAKIVDSIEKPGGYATGVSNLMPSEPQFEMFRKIQPNLKKLGIIFSPGEPNSLDLNEEMKVSAAKLGIELVFSPALRSSDVATAAQKLRDKVDAFFVNNDNIALSAFGTIVRVAEEVGKPVYVSDTDMVEQSGALAALGPNQYELGRQTGEMLVKVLKGTPVGELPVEYSKLRKVVVNPGMAEKLGIKLPKIELLEKSGK